MKKENKNLDELFREKLNSDKEAFLSSKNDWEVLKQKLDLGEKRRQRLFVYKTLLGVAAALLIFFSIWYVMPDDQDLLKPQEALSVKSNVHDHDSLTMQHKEEPVEKITEDVNVKESFLNIVENTKPVTDRTSIEFRTNANRVARNEIDRNVKVYTMPYVDETSPSSPEMNNKLVYQLPINKTDLLSNRLRHLVVQLDKSAQPKMDRRKNIVLSVLVAPALNGIGGFKNGDFGSDFGLLVSVDLSKRLNISTGAVYAKKLYEADFNRNLYPNIGGYEYSGGGYGEHNGASGYDRVFPEEVYADCRVLDIPLNINYTLMKKGRNELSIGTGISSYIMLSEKYRFEYADQTNTSPETLNLRNENKHLMSIVNFQASYTRQLNSKVGISLQPYLKIPLTDIGYAKARLQSVGLAVNINFTLNSNKK